ncbi:hypothetical protein STRDD11_01290 [Streptococcus sp. DD11]|nr:hypothetical protein STRDD11_01290 [Streptococcus sp. DD11]
MERRERGRECRQRAVCVKLVLLFDLVSSFYFYRLSVCF